MAGASRTEWTVPIGELLRRDDLETALETPASIFKLPESRTQGNPQAYSPCRLFLGPFHEFRPELQKMEIFKLQNAKKAKQKFELPELTQLVDQLMELDVQIRACYGQNLAIGSQALASTILIDGLFMLRLLGISPYDKQYREDEEDQRDQRDNTPPRVKFWGRCLGGDISITERLPVFGEQRLYLNAEENIAAQIEIAKDLLKLENQIPIHVLKRVLSENLFQKLPFLFYKFCSSVSPLSLPPYDNPNFPASTHSWFPKSSEILDQSQHLLHYLYALFFYQRFLAIGSGGGARSGAIFVELLNMMAQVIGLGFLQQLVGAVGLIQTLLGLAVKVRQSSSSATDDDSPKIPSASQLKKVWVKFEGGAYSANFDEQSATLKLPTITINEFWEVVLRNVVAFEVEAKLKPASFSHYVKLMSGLIGTAKDVRILRRAGVVTGGRSGDEDAVVKLFKELGSLVEVGSDEGESKYSFLNYELCAMEEMKGYYESCWVVKAERFGKRYICPLIQVLMLLVVVALILIVVIRTVCGWFSCPKIFGHSIMKLGYYSL